MPDYFSTPIITICCFISYDCNNSLRITCCWSNESIPIITSITLVNKRDLEHCAAWSFLPSIWRQNILFLMEEFFDWSKKCSPKWFKSWCCSYKFLVNCWINTVIIFPWCYKLLSVVININVCNWILTFFFIVCRSYFNGVGRFLIYSSSDSRWSSLSSL